LLETLGKDLGTPRTHTIPAIKATGIENKDTKEGTHNDGTQYTGIAGCTI
jgi:hypothetical protein